MSYKLKKSETVQRGMRRMAHEQLDKAIDELADPELDAHDKVHQVRKRFKKLRGLIRPSLGDTYDQENTYYRDLGRKFSRLRDAESLIECLNDLRDAFPAQLASQVFVDVREQLRARRLKIVEDWDDLDESLAILNDELKEASQRVDHWSLDDHGFSAVAGGLEKTWTRARKALEAAREAPTDENLHQWRKRVKYHWYHIRILRKIWKASLNNRCDILSDLADDLGDDHDLAVFTNTLDKEPAAFGDPHSFDQLHDVIEQRRADLQKRAFAAGRRVFAESPDALIDRYHTYWKVWR